MRPYTYFILFLQITIHKCWDYVVEREHGNGEWLSSLTACKFGTSDLIVGDGHDILMYDYMEGSCSTWEEILAIPKSKQTPWPGRYELTGHTSDICDVVSSSNIYLSGKVTKTIHIKNVLNTNNINSHYN